MGDWSFDEPLKVGDKIIFEDMIHYTIVKTSMFNGIPHPHWLSGVKTMNWYFIGRSATKIIKEETAELVTDAGSFK